jgi:hypothetical protein
MDKKMIFERVFPDANRLGIRFNEFRSILERNDFSDIEGRNLRLKNMPLVGEQSLLSALNVDVEDPETVAEVSSILPAFTIFFSQPGTKSSAIDLLKAQVEAVKKMVTNFQTSLMSGITGKEEASEYSSTIPGIDKMIGEDNLTTGFINKVIKTFTGSIAGSGGSMNINEFATSEDGKKLISLLRGLRVDAPIPRLIDSIFSPVLSKLETQDLRSVMNSLDEVSMPEITADNIEMREVNDYLSSRSEVSELEMAESMDPYMRLGLFYQLCLLQQENFIANVTSDTKGTKLNYPDFIKNGAPFTESMRTLFGRNADLSALDPFIGALNELSLYMMDNIWNSPKSDRTKTTLFVPAMQVFYASLMNFVLANALYSFLTKKSNIVMSAKQAEIEKAKAEAQKLTKVPSTMSDEERGKMITKIFRSAPLQGLLNDKTIYIPGKAGYDPDKVKALKELVYYSFGGKQSKFDKIKNWDISKNPLDGNYDQFFSDLIKDLQTEYSIRPIRAGKGDGKVGPNTKSFFKEQIPDAVVELI